MDLVIKSYIIMAIDAIFFFACYFIFWVLSASYLFDFTRHERELFSLIRFTSLILVILTPPLVFIMVGRNSPESKNDYAKLKRNYHSLKKIQKLGLIFLICGLIFLGVGFIVPIYLRFFYGFVPLELLYDNFFYFGAVLSFIGFDLFYLFFRRKKLKKAKTSSDLFKDEETQNGS
ncbi:MAG: hypothetical protein ACTSRT_20410 [Promethearchaeota archaeon]